MSEEVSDETEYCVVDITNWEVRLRSSFNSDKEAIRELKALYPPHRFKVFKEVKEEERRT